MARGDRPGLVGAGGSLGKGLKKRLPPDLWAAVEQCFAGAQPADNWAALAQTVEIYRRVAIEVGESLGYTYPDELHQRVMAYVEQISPVWMPPMNAAGRKAKHDVRP